MAWRQGSPGAGIRGKLMLALPFAICAFVALMPTSAATKTDSPVGAAAPTGNTAAATSTLEESYQRLWTGWESRGIRDAAGALVAVEGGNYTAASAPGLLVEPSLAGRRGRILNWAAEEGWVEYDISVPQEGLYQIELDYLALPGRGSSIQRALRIDGEYQYNELKRLEFPRLWREAGRPLKDSLGDEYNPRSVEATRWQTVFLTHPDGLAAEPLRVHLTRGRHRLRFEAIREPMAIARLRVRSPLRPPSYADVARAYAANGYADVRDASVKVQAEDSYERSSPTIRREQDREPLTEPHAGKNIVLNILGGETWRQGGSWASWRVKVPKTGLYRLDIRYQQSYLPDFAAGRSLFIDGKLPFAEAAFVEFPYNPNGWQVLSVGGEKPYRFHLTAGMHTITLQVCSAQVGPVIDRVRGLAVDMAFLIQRVLQITGPATDDPEDPYREWELTKQLPDLKPSLERMIRELDDCILNLRRMVGRKQDPQSAAQLAQVRDQLRDLARDPDSLPRRLTQYRDNQAKLGAWVLNLMQQGLALDYLALMPPGAPQPRGAASVVRRIWQSVRDLFGSFTRDYTQIGTFHSQGQARKEKRLKVWVAYPRDYARILKELADEDFTPRTGIRLDVNVIPSTNVFSALILSYNAGRAPDVCVGLWSPHPVEFAMRNAGVDLTRLKGYDEVKERFLPGSLVPLSYGGGVWALPESQDFWMLFYRKDILNRLGLKVPDTWEEVFALIPRLQMRGMDFYYPYPTSWNENREFTPFLYQNGGSFYTEDGLRSGLNSPQALKAFKIWTQLYTDYNTPIQADFFSRFRTGEMPIGIDDYYMYSRLAVAAPELTGWWQMAPLPGMVKPDGKGGVQQDANGRPLIDRSMGGYAFTCMMFRTTRDKEAAWEFMKWWTSTDVQIRFGTKLEGIVGVEARWNSANVEALKGLPWAKRDIDAIIEQWNWFRERPVVVGGYITQRYVYNAWNQVVYSVLYSSGKGTYIPPREALEDAVRHIDRELLRKQREFFPPPPGRRAGGGE